jgi:GNAT superfamily N-acetyltransferase
MTTPTITYRQATAADLDTCAEILYVADDELTVRRGLPASPHNREALIRLYAHMQRHFPDRFHVAHDGKRIVGFGASTEYQEMVYLGFLFVLPETQASGIGRRLLELSMHDSSYRAVAIASYQPISAALYAWYGMVPRIPIYMMTGAPTVELPALPPQFAIRRIPVAVATALDMEICGLKREIDHEWWESMGRMRFGLYDGMQLLGYGYMQETGRLGPFVVRISEHLLPFVGRLIAEAPDVEAWMINVPGAASETFVGLLHAGFRLEGPPAIFCATELRLDYSRYLPASYALP